MEPIRLSLQPGGSTYPDNPHEGEEFGYVMQGEITIHIGKQTYHAEAGESFLLYACEKTLHYIKKGAELIWVSSPPSYRKGRTMASSLIELRHIYKSFEDTQVLDDFNLTVNENEFITLLGPSGRGKTTTLRIVGGFEKPDSGQVFFEGKDITDVPPNQRHLNTVFQKYALFPHMNVGQNIAFGLKISGKSEDYIRDKVKYALKLVNLDGYEKRKIDQLSGGQRRRIAMAKSYRERTEGLCFWTSL